MRTQAQIEASRRNGAKSSGPITEEGKTRSSQNAIKHGLSANKFVVLEGESGDDWETFHQSYIAKFQPRDPVKSTSSSKWPSIAGACNAPGPSKRPQSMRRASGSVNWSKMSMTSGMRL